MRSTDGSITISDRVATHWLLGVFLLAGGVLTTAAAFGLVANASALRRWERAAALVIGLGGSSGALLWLRGAPKTRVHLDLSRRRMQVARLGVTGRTVEEFAFEDVAAVVIERSQDDDGGHVSRPAVHLQNGVTIRISELWSHDHQGVRTVAAAVADACQLTRPTE